MTQPIPQATALALAIALTGCATTAPVAPAASATAAVPAQASKAQRLNALYEQYWEEVLRMNPVQATFQGDARYNDQLPDFLSAEFRQQARAFNARWLKTMEDIGPDGLTGQDLLSYEIFVRDAKLQQEAERFPGWQQPINQFGSIASFAVQLGSGTGAQPFKTVKDYENWLARGNRLPVLFDSAIANMRQGMASGVVQPRALMVKVLPQLDALIKDKPEDTLFWGPIARMPADFSAQDKARLTAAYREMIGERVMPAYRELRAFIANANLPTTRTAPGNDALPDAAAWYAYTAKNSTPPDHRRAPPSPGPLRHRPRPPRSASDSHCPPPAHAATASADLS